jgi:transposase-like protein
VDQDGNVIDILVQSHRNQRATAPFFQRLLRGQSAERNNQVAPKMRLNRRVCKEPEVDSATLIISTTSEFTRRTISEVIDSARPNGRQLFKHALSRILDR